MIFPNVVNGARALKKEAVKVAENVTPKLKQLANGPQLKPALVTDTVEIGMKKPLSSLKSQASNAISLCYQRGAGGGNACYQRGAHGAITNMLMKATGLQK